MSEPSIAFKGDTVIASFDEQGAPVPGTPGEEMRLYYVAGMKEIRQQQLDGELPVAEPLRALKQTHKDIRGKILPSNIPETEHMIVISDAIRGVMLERIMRSRSRLSVAQRFGEALHGYAYSWEETLGEISTPLTPDDLRLKNPIPVIFPSLSRIATLIPRRESEE
ncbi:MAG: hypothetical protein ACHQT9_00150 [Candidatus Saccharimonadales bacterium]